MLDGKKKEFFTVAILSLLLVLIPYGQLLFAKFVADVDSYLYTGLKTISSPGEYWRAWQQHQIYDIQFVRDLSYFLDQHFEYYLQLPTYHYTNIFLWVITIISLYYLVDKISALHPKIKMLLVSVFALHPIFAKTITHIGARKHLLSFLFITLFLNSYLQEKQQHWRALKMSTFFLLSLFSQPINIFLPCWCFVYSRVIKSQCYREIAKELLPLFLFSLLLGFVNLWWYLAVDQEALGVAKYAAENSSADRLLALGRYFAFYLLPIRFAEFYGPQSPLTVIGLCLAPLFSWICMKRMRREVFLVYTLLFYLAIFPVILQMFNTFVSETYFLLGASALFFLTILLFDKITWNIKKIIPLIILVLILGSYTGYLVSLRTNPAKIWQASYENDSNCINLYYLVEDLFAQDKIDEAVNYGREMVARHCMWVNKVNIDRSRAVYAKILLFSNLSIPNSAKEQQLRDLAQANYYLKLHLALFYLMNNQVAPFNAILQEGRDHHVQFVPEDLIIKHLRTHCQKLAISGCRVLAN